MTVEQVTEQRLRRERKAAERASQLEPGDYYASGNFLMRRMPGASAVGSVVMECETHWDACLVMIAIKQEPGK